MSTTADSPTQKPVAETAQTATTASPADRFMRKILVLPEGKTATSDDARSAFQKSLFISATRCLLMYIVFPFVLPAVGIARGVGPWIGLMIGVLAMFSIIFSVRRFWRADHSKRWHYTIFGAVIIGFLIFLAVKDGADLIG